MRVYYKTSDGRYVTDLEPQAGSLIAAIGPAPLFVRSELATAHLPDGWEWIDEAQWERIQDEMRQLTLAEAQAVEPAIVQRHARNPMT